LSYLEAGDPASAADLLGAFQNQIDAQRGKKLTEAQAAVLLAHAEAILAAIGPAPVSPLSSSRGRVGLKGAAEPVGLQVAQQPTIGTDGRGTILQLSWGSAGVLQSAQSLEGPWEDVPQQVAPFWTETGGSGRFFRIQTPHLEAD
jgi:hypothetical protein